MSLAGHRVVRDEYQESVLLFPESESASFEFLAARLLRCVFEKPWWGKIGGVNYVMTRSYYLDGRGVGLSFILWDSHPT